jgi:hypothetical protein
LETVQMAANTARAMAQYPDVAGTGRSAAVTAYATAAHAEMLGALYAHGVSPVMMHGEAVVKSTKRPADRKMAIVAPNS